MHGTAAVGAVEGQEPWFEADEGDGVGRPHRRAEDAAGIGFEPARNIHREHGHGRRVQEPHRFEVSAADLPLQTDAEETIDHEIPALVSGYLGLRGAAGFAPRLGRAGGIGGQLRGVADEHQRHVEPPALQVACDDERIPAVVAGTGEDEHRVAGAGNELARELGGGEPRALHELGRVGQSGRSLLDLSDLAGEIDRREIVIGNRDHGSVEVYPERGVLSTRV